jgi:hypothetical protein
VAGIYSSSMMNTRASACAHTQILTRHPVLPVQKKHNFNGNCSFLWYSPYHAIPTHSTSFLPGLQYAADADNLALQDQASHPPAWVSKTQIGPLSATISCRAGLCAAEHASEVKHPVPFDECVFRTPPLAAMPPLTHALSCFNSAFPSSLLFLV